MDSDHPAPSLHRVGIARTLMILWQQQCNTTTLHAELSCERHESGPAASPRPPLRHDSHLLVAMSYTMVELRRTAGAP